MWWWLFLSVTVGTAARFFIQTYAQSMTSPSHAAVIMIVEPVWTSLFAAMWFGERMEASQLAGCGLIFLALIVNRWKAVRLWLKRA
jgi:drug/metabolite transporter (DMT)-like permease